MALPQNRPGVRAILEAVEPRILGIELEGLRCSCGAIHCPTAIATAVEPAGNQYPGQETCWALWLVSMTPKEPGEPWCCGLSQFVPVQELKALFDKHFPGHNGNDNPYKLEVKDADRVWANLPAAVCIMDTNYQTRFTIDWGREQRLAEKADQLFTSNPRFMLYGSEGYKRVVELLRRLSPQTYQGGPEPELPGEPLWLTDYTAAVDALDRASYKKVFYQNGFAGFDYRGESYNSMDIVFSKRD